MLIASLIILAHVVAVIALSGFYFHRYRITRPPIGVFNLGDVAVLLGAIVLVPYLYLGLPSWLVATLLGAGMTSLLFIIWEPLLSRPLLIWLTALLPVGLDLAGAWWFGAHSLPFFISNNLVLLMAVIGIANLWVQGGMSARAMAVMAGALAVYDLLFTAQLPLMADLFYRLAPLPLAPLVAWPINRSPGWMGLGLGDLIFAAVPPLVLHKAFGRRAGAMAGFLSTLAIGLVMLLPLLGVRAAAFPVMVVLGPAIVGQYIYWRRSCGSERTIWQYWRSGLLGE